LPGSKNLLINNVAIKLCVEKIFIGIFQNKTIPLIYFRKIFKNESKLRKKQGVIRIKELGVA